MAQWRYKHIRLNYRGRGITQEIDVLDVDGERLTGWADSKTMPTVAVVRHPRQGGLGAGDPCNPPRRIGRNGVPLLHAAPLTGQV